MDAVVEQAQPVQVYPKPNTSQEQHDLLVKMIVEHRGTSIRTSRGIGKSATPQRASPTDRGQRREFAIAVVTGQIARD
jgi:hypothetical protein